MKGFGILLLVIAAAAGGYALFFFDTTVSTGYGNVHNVGLLQQRQNMLIVAGVLAVVGALMAVFGRSAEVSPEVQFSQAVMKGDVALMQRLIDAGKIDPNGRAPGGTYSWLRHAVSHEALEACEALLRNGADPHLPDGLPGTVAAYVADSSPTTQRRSARLSSIRALFESPPQRMTRGPAEASPVAPGKQQAESPIRTLTDQIAELVKLRDSGALSAEEFDRAKAKVLG